MWMGICAKTKGWQGSQYFEPCTRKWEMTKGHSAMIDNSSNI